MATTVTAPINEYAGRGRPVRVTHTRFTNQVRYGVLDRTLVSDLGNAVYEVAFVAQDGAVAPRADGKVVLRVSSDERLEFLDEGFDGYAEPTPDGDWAYDLDDHAITYRWRALGDPYWPFADLDGTPGRSVRLAPNTEYKSWRNEYVSVYPDHERPHLATANLTLWIRPQGMGGMVCKTASVALDLAAGTATVTGWVPTALREQAETKAARILAFMKAAIAERASGVKVPSSAYDRWIASGGKP
jgi:hypothetical protein